MSTKLLPATHKLYRVPKPDIFSRGVPARLPVAYKKFYEEWRSPNRSPVHYEPESGKWKRNPLTGEVWPVQNVPIKLQIPDEANTGIWGGEGAIRGFKQKVGRWKPKVTGWWMPELQRSVVYSEILDKRLSVIVTKRTIQLICDHHGFDNYILKTAANDLISLLALKLKKKMLIALFDKTLYPENPDKREEVYNKYKHYLANFNREDLEWYGLNLIEAVFKLENMEDSIQPKPLKLQFRAELIEELKTMAANNELDNVLKEEETGKTRSWLKRINPFAKKT